MLDPIRLGKVQKLFFTETDPTGIRQARFSALLTTLLIPKLDTRLEIRFESIFKIKFSVFNYGHKYYLKFKKNIYLNVKNSIFKNYRVITYLVAKGFLIEQNLYHLHFF